MRPSLLALVAIPGLLAAAPAGAASAPLALKPITRTLSASATTAATCATVAPRTAAGVATTRYTAPMSGFVTTRLAASDASNWDLSLVDAASGRRMNSQAFGSHEVVQSWVTSGQRLVVVACRRSGSASRATASIAFVAADLPKPTGPAQLVRVRFKGSTAKMADALDRIGLDATESRGRGWIDVLVGGDQHKLLKKTGLRYTVRVKNMNAASARSAQADAAAAADGPSPLPTGRTTYRTYDEIQTELAALVAANPDRVKPVKIGTSYQGRPLQGVEIANNVNATDGRPVYMVVATHHAREWPAAEAAMEYAALLASGGNGDATVADLLDRERTVIVPLINPDGYVSSRTLAAVDPADLARDNGVWEKTPAALPKDPTTHEPNIDACEVGCVPPSTAESIAPPGGLFSYRRKTCAGAVPNPNMPCELQYGVDPNRNYGELWGGPGSSADPTSQSYHGPGPWSEPETQAVHKYSQEHQVTALITLHNVAALVLRPPGTQNNGFAPDEDALKELGDAMAAATGYTSQYGFQLYDTTGTTEDWNYAAAGTFGYTIEIGPEGGSFHLPYQEAFVDQWTGKYADDKTGTPGHGGLRAALLEGGVAAADRAHHGVITGNAKAGRILRVHKDFTTVTSSYCSMGQGGTPIYFTSGPLNGPTEHGVCLTGQMPPQAIADKIDTTTIVPDSGHFVWDVGPSTRPFVAAKGITERWRFTCESPTKVLATKFIEIKRGETVDLGDTTCVK